MAKNSSEVKSKNAGYIFALLATAIWSGNFIIARNLSETIPPVTIAFWRWSIALLVFTPFALNPFFNNWKIIKSNLGYILITSLIGVTIFNTLIYIAGKTTTAINLSLISITFPIFILIISKLFYNETITFVKIAGIFLVSIGVMVILTKGDLSSLFQLNFYRGDLWMLLASLIFAIYSVLLKRKPKELSLIPFQYATFLFGLLMLFPFFILEVTFTEQIVYNNNSILSFVYLGVGASLLAFIFWNKAINLIGPTKSGMIYYTLPLFSGFLAFLILGEKLEFVHFISAILIVSGILISNKN